MNPTRRLALALLFVGACQPPVVATEHDGDAHLDHALYLAMAPAVGPGWTFNGGDGTRFGDANGACQAFAQSYQQGLGVDRLDKTANHGIKTCWVKAPEDSVASQSTLVMLEGEDGAVELANADDLVKLEAALGNVARECENQIGQPKDGQSCSSLGTQKHKCAAGKLGVAQGLVGGPPKVYSGPAFDRWGNMYGKLNPDGDVPPRVPRTEAAFEAQAIAFFNSGNSPFNSVGQAIAAAKTGKLFPDVVVPTDPTKRLEKGNVAAIYDFKFPCPPDKQAAWGFNGSTAKRQDRAYNDALSPTNPAERIQPGG